MPCRIYLVGLEHTKNAFYNNFYSNKIRKISIKFIRLNHALIHKKISQIGQSKILGKIRYVQAHRLSAYDCEKGVIARREQNIFRNQFFFYTKNIRGLVLGCIEADFWR